jgi:ABC-2 type transport system ATP-binding protein
MSPSLALDVRGLHKAFGSVIAVNGLDLAVPEGACFGLLGPNGAGKTTTIEICEGLTSPDRGTVTVLGKSWATSERELRQRLGIQLQETQVSEKLTCSETLALFRSFYDRGRPVAEVLDLVALGEKRNARVGTLSGGQKQRLAVACALVGDPDLLFLDEPTTGLDPQSRRQLWDVIEEFRRTGRTIVLTTHYMDEAQRLCDTVAIVDHGKVIALGSPAALIAEVCSEQMISLSTSGSASPIATDRIAAIPGVASARNTTDSIEIFAAEPHQVIPTLLTLISSDGHTLERLQTHTPTLEDVFVQLTGRQLRDG